MLEGHCYLYFIVEGFCEIFFTMFWYVGQPIVHENCLVTDLDLQIYDYNVACLPKYFWHELPLTPYSDIFVLYVSVIVTSLEGGSVDYKQLKELETKDYTQEIISTIYMGLSKLLKCALKLPQSSLKQEVRDSFISFNGVF